MDSLPTQIYIDYILSDPNVSLIEVWDGRLFVWKYKGSPRIHTNLGLTYKHIVYYRPNEFRKISQRYHPDISKSKSKRVTSGYIQQCINTCKNSMVESQKGEYDPSEYLWGHEEYSRIISCKDYGTRSIYLQEFQARLYDHSRMVQDRFSIPRGSSNNIFTAAWEYSNATGKNLKDVVTDFTAEANQCNRQRAIKRWNKPCGSPDPKESDYTNFGQASRALQESLRREYGDVFRMYVRDKSHHGTSKKRKYK